VSGTRARAGCVILVLLFVNALRSSAAQVSLKQAAELAKIRIGVSLDSEAQSKLFNSCRDLDQDTLPVLQGPPDIIDLAESHSPTSIDLASQSLATPFSTVGLTQGAKLRSHPIRESFETSVQPAFCAAVLYVQLANLATMAEILRDQEDASQRLLKAEAARILKRIDEPASLIRAKLLSAQTRIWMVEVQRATIRLRKLLAGLTGLREDEIEIVADSIPSFPVVTTQDNELTLAVTQASGARDVAQLSHALARDQRLRTRVRVLEGKGNLGDLLAAYIFEDAQLVALIDVNSRFDCVSMRLLQAEAQFNDWVLAPISGPDGFKELRIAQAMIAQTLPPYPAAGASTAETQIRSIMITPGISKLQTGQSQQFSAIAIQSNGHGADASSNAIWQCSNKNAIMSTSGMITALSPGRVTITATVSGVQQISQIEISEGSVDSLLTP
jgi:hypothetical protein